MNDLKRAGVDIADNVFILGHGNKMLKKLTFYLFIKYLEGKKDDLSIDARPLMIFRLIKNWQAFPLIELGYY